MRWQSVTLASVSASVKLVAAALRALMSPKIASVGDSAGELRSLGGCQLYNKDQRPFRGANAAQVAVALSRALRVQLAPLFRRVAQIGSGWMISTLEIPSLIDSERVVRSDLTRGMWNTRAFERPLSSNSRLTRGNLTVMC